ncbi:hypothetical protein P280DRAFT_271311 [Massarina eburnea CBS 473.64]|uniref:Uncharacterized protein n=1 Tax=Massarina eburnea CBS 473.64 TaxID=1395130 RepID=A0A6A6S4X6_9PLEO|nr:hypothetical protein P280DRAFT_271311 [Massarina eburnea CBS 473.64]
MAPNRPGHNAIVALQQETVHAASRVHPNHRPDPLHSGLFNLQEPPMAQPHRRQSVRQRANTADVPSEDRQTLANNVSEGPTLSTRPPSRLRSPYGRQAWGWESWLQTPITIGPESPHYCENPHAPKMAKRSMRLCARR